MAIDSQFAKFTKVFPTTILHYTVLHVFQCLANTLQLFLYTKETFIHKISNAHVIHYYHTTMYVSLSTKNFIHETLVTLTMHRMHTLNYVVRIVFNLGKYF